MPTGLGRDGVGTLQGDIASVGSSRLAGRTDSDHRPSSCQARRSSLYFSCAPYATGHGGDSSPQVKLPQTETPGMPPKTITTISRALTQARSRRLAFTALVAVAAPSRAEAGNRCRARAQRG